MKTHFDKCVFCDPILKEEYLKAIETASIDNPITFFPCEKHHNEIFSKVLLFSEKPFSKLKELLDGKNKEENKSLLNDITNECTF